MRDPGQDDFVEILQDRVEGLPGLGRTRGQARTDLAGAHPGEDGEFLDAPPVVCDPVEDLAALGGEGLGSEVVHGPGIVEQNRVRRCRRVRKEGATRHREATPPGEPHLARRDPPGDGLPNNGESEGLPERRRAAYPTAGPGSAARRRAALAAACRDRSKVRILRTPRL